MTAFEVEVGENAKLSRCDCCGAESATGHGFVYKGGLAHAVYFVGWSHGHRERGVTMAIAVGQWSDSSAGSDKTCFGVEALLGEKQILFRFIGPEESPWSHTELLGQMISEGEARDSGIRAEILAIAEQVVRAHPAVCEFLSLSAWTTNDQRLEH